MTATKKTKLTDGPEQQKTETAAGTVKPSKKELMRRMTELLKNRTEVSYGEILEVFNDFCFFVLLIWACLDSLPALV